MHHIHQTVLILVLANILCIPESFNPPCLCIRNLGTMYSAPMSYNKSLGQICEIYVSLVGGWECGFRKSGGLLSSSTEWEMVVREK